MRGKNSASEVMPPVLGLPPAIQKMSAKQASACADGIGVGRLGIVDEQHRALAADLLHAVREAGKRAQPRLDRRGVEPERQRRRRRAGGVLRVVQAAQRADAVERRDRLASLPPAARMIAPFST